MAPPLARVGPACVVVNGRRPLVRGGVATIGGLVDVVGRGIAIGFGLAILVVAGTGPAALATIGVLAIGSALVSWSE